MFTRTSTNYLDSATNSTFHTDAYDLVRSSPDYPATVGLHTHHGRKRKEKAEMGEGSEIKKARLEVRII